VEKNGVKERIQMILYQALYHIEIAYKKTTFLLLLYLDKNISD